MKWNRLMPALLTGLMLGAIALWPAAALILMMVDAK